MALPGGCSTPAQDQAVSNILEAVSDLSSSTAALASFCSTCTISRYLCARAGDVEAAAAMLKCALQCGSSPSIAFQADFCLHNSPQTA